jgi:hypothetical protein
MRMIEHTHRVSSRPYRRPTGSSDVRHHMPAILASAFVALLFCAQIGQAKISAQYIAELIQSSDEVVIATVTEVSEASPSTGGFRLATAETSRTLKGAPLRTVRFYASPGWICDTSHAISGEMVLLFLNGHIDGNFSIALAGRGYMPLRNVDGKEYATLWTEVILPKDAPVIPGPDPKYDFIVSVELTYIEALIEGPEALTSSAQALERTRESLLDTAQPDR